MIFAAGIAAQTASALAQAMHSRPGGAPATTPSGGGASPFTADIDSLLANAQNGLSGLAAGAGAMLGNLQSMAGGLFGLGAAPPAPPATPQAAGQAYAAAGTLAT